MTKRFQADQVLARLKDFQLRTVEYVFGRMFAEHSPARRFLVADEVGLGKTLVAQGLIAKSVEHLQDTGRRIDIIYICSNSDIAAQNVRRLNVTGQKTFVKATRLTLLPLEVKSLRQQRINFISFTPGTTFDHGRRGGHKLERKLIYRMLAGQIGIGRKGLARVLQATAGEGWFSEIEGPLEFDTDIARDFIDAVAASDVVGHLRELSSLLSDLRRKLQPEAKQQALTLIGHLRRILARCCLDALEPDLVILDEFQRFRELLGSPESSPSAELAHALFNYSDDLRVLLLSATPYKMYASAHEDEDHYKDFIETTRFLFDDDTQVARLEAELRAFRDLLMSSGIDDASMHGVAEVRLRIEGLLKTVMCRTERVNASAGLDSMVREVRDPLSLSVDDLQEFRCIDKLGSALGVNDPIEYWRSSPYLLNFMKDYELKRRMTDKKNGALVAETLATHPYRLLGKRDIERYRPVDPANGRLRTLIADINTSESWRLLWVPPSFPYWQGSGAYEGGKGFTKTLIFSSWNVVPDAIAGLVSYFVESKAVSGLDRGIRYEQLAKQLRPRLRFPAKQDGTFPGMSALALMYPCRTLANALDPLELGIEQGGRATLAEVRSRAREIVSRLLDPLEFKAAGDLALPDRRWYWVSLILLDRRHHPEMRAWCEQAWSGARRNEDLDTPGGFWSHVRHWLACWDGATADLGRVPDDLPDVLADMTLSGPAICAYRSLRRVVPERENTIQELRSAAVHIAEGFRSQFNAPEAIALLQNSDDEDAYWQRTLHYGVEGNLQALLDEYIHLLHEAESDPDGSPAATALRVAEAVFSAASIRTSQLRPDYLQTVEGRIVIDQEPLTLRSKYAVRYGQAEDEDGAVSRKEVVRAAFNSPFRPFVLASTSVGQEGLDFHSWCHSIVHWNLPSNPVDLEQREGRVHRYKGHAVRRNVSLVHRAAVTSLDFDPWEAMFCAARETRATTASDLVPFWIFEAPEGVKVERHVFHMPMSKDESRLHKIKSSLAVYRMVFGQPRQDDLMEHLLRRFDETTALEMVRKWRINLEPTDR